MTIITSKYRTDTTRRFVDDVYANDYYLFASSISNAVFSNTNDSKLTFLEKTLFGKKILPENVFYMIKNYIWETGTVYEQYDDREDISNKKYYAVVYPQNNETGDYRIYKCLFNNYRAASTNPPNFNNATPDQVYEMPDGYVWKFLYSISVPDFDKYNSRGYIPIYLPEANSSLSDTSSVDQIFVENPTENSGYERVLGTIDQVLGGVQNTVTIIPSAAGTLSAIENYYTGYTFYVTNAINQSQVYEVDTYVFNPSTGKAIITLVEGIPVDGVLVDAAVFILLPRVEIRGDGTGAVAIPNVSSTGSIESITILNKGSGYTRAIARVPDPFAFDPSSLNSLDERVLLRPVISTPGGHGSNLVDELSCRHVLLYTELTQNDNLVVPTTNQYRSVGIVKNPEFKVFPNPTVFDNRIEVALDTNPFFENEIITQIETANTSSIFFNETRFEAKVHAISGNFAYLAEYSGPFANDAGMYANNDFSDISLDVTLPLISSLNQLVTINTDNNPSYGSGYGIDYPGFKLSPYVQRTGEVYYISQFPPITRTANAREQYKIVLEF
jgi:hypothetical protein